MLSLVEPVFACVVGVAECEAFLSEKPFPIAPGRAFYCFCTHICDMRVFAVGRAYFGRLLGRPRNEKEEMHAIHFFFFDGATLRERTAFMAFVKVLQRCEYIFCRR